MRNAKDLLIAYKAGTCTEEEKQLIEKWFLLHGAGNVSDLSEEDFLQAEAAMRNTITGLKVKRRLPLYRQTWLRFTAAAVVLLVCGIGAYKFYGLNRPQEQVLANDIAPGGNKAILTLANGKKISLTDAGSGEVARQEGMKVVKEANGRVVYVSADERKNTGNISYNVVSTPRGGKFEVLLPDGTKVWLNAATSITFPTSFEGLKERKIKLNGEAYFEVKHDKAIPFRVDMGKQEVEVLGTHFNANNYADEPVIRTTLMEGSVKVFNQVQERKGGLSEVVLKPDEQAELLMGRLSVKAVDAQGYADWKDGTFCFKDAEIGEAMRQLARWYDVEIEYKGKIPDWHLTGYVLRTTPISKTFPMLEKISDLKYNLNGKKVIVSF